MQRWVRILMWSFVALAWANFLLSAWITGRPDGLAWLSATLILIMVLVSTRLDPGDQPIRVCIECFRPDPSPPFCIGCGRVVKAEAA
ncbi:MAG TPA: hypothetical protein VFH47_08975 [Candidatus Thermoplasmatota archaeon]|nr:hypothetical protein [Candidatus Thermoplasmatota archaeon]